MPRTWYVYKGTGSIDTPSNYSKFVGGVGFPTACSGGPTLCAIYTPAGGSAPLVISDNIQNYIAAGLGTNLNQPQFPPGTRIYVRLKSNLA